MKHDLKINDKFSIDFPKFRAQQSLLQASPGGGKSWTIRRILEQTFGRVPHIILDTEGEFSTLREKYEYILIGKDQSIVADPKTAALMALRIWEEGVSAIIDLYELSPWDRQTFVKNFIDAMINAPKALWNPVYLVIDEVHEYAPEGDRTECGRSLHLLASKGRKRNIGVMYATQRISTLSKNVVASCKNKFIGYTSLDADMKRAAAELGFSTQEERISLRKLDPGEFYAFGPAISKEIVKFQVGEVVTSHGDEAKAVGKIAPASDKVKKALAKLADLPQAAAEEAKTVEALKSENRLLKAELKRIPQKSVEIDPKTFEKAVLQAVSKKDKEIATFKAKLYQELLRSHGDTLKALERLGLSIEKVKEAIPKEFIHGFLSPGGEIEIKKVAFPLVPKHFRPESDITDIKILGFHDVPKKFGQCAKSIYSVLIAKPNAQYTKTQLAVASGYSQNSGGFNNSISELVSADLIARVNGGFVAKTDDPDMKISVDTSIEKWVNKVSGCASKILRVVLDSGTLDKATIATSTGYSVTSGGFNNSLSELSSLGLIERMQGGMIRINPEILEI